MITGSKRTNHGNTKLAVKQRAAGFTLVELVTVTALLGTLSAVALPRFIDLTDSANESVVDGFAASLQSGLALHRSIWEIRERPAVLEGFTAVTTAQGVLTGLTDNNQAQEGDCRAIWEDLIDTPDETAFVSSINGYSSTFTGDRWGQNASPIGSLGETQDVFCHFVYINGQNNAPVLRYNIATGVLDRVVWPFAP